MATLLHVSKFVLRVVCEAYLAMDSRTVISYRIGHSRFSIIIYSLSKAVRLFAICSLPHMTKYACRTATKMHVVVVVF